MKVVNSNQVPRFGTRKQNEREYMDCANILENCSRPLTPEQRLIEGKERKRNRNIKRYLLLPFLLVITICAIMIAANIVFVIVIWPVKIVIFAVVALLWFWFWFSGLD